MWQAWVCVCIHTLSWDMCGVWVGALGGVFVSAAKVSVQCGKWGRCHEICLWELLSCV